MSNAQVAEKELSGDDVAESRQEMEPNRIDWKTIWKPMVLIGGTFLVRFYLPMDSKRFTNAVMESLSLAKWYAQEHVLLCLVPAFFIAGAISCFVSQAACWRRDCCWAGPALSLPNMLVIRSVMGAKKTAVFVTLVVVMATLCGMASGRFFPG